MRAIMRAIRHLFKTETADIRAERAETKSKRLTSTVAELRQSQEDLAGTLEETGFFLGDALQRNRPAHDQHISRGNR